MLLMEHFVEHQHGGVAHVQRIGAPVHGDEDAGILRFVPCLTDAVAFVAHHDGDATPVVGLPVAELSIGVRGDDLEALALEPGYGFARLLS